jgi:SpoVK/Ycf46/Vps4 family AAA+-type ATPase
MNKSIDAALEWRPRDAVQCEKATAMVVSSKAAMAAYVSGFLRALDPAAPAGRRLTGWLRYNGNLLGLDFDAAIRPPKRAGRTARMPSPDRPILPRSWAKLGKALDTVALREAGADDAVAANFAAFTAALGLSEAQASVLRFVFETGRNSAFDRLCDAMLETRAADTNGLIALGVGMESGAVAQAVSAGKLAGLQLLKIYGRGGDRFGAYIPHRVLTALLPPGNGITDIERNLIGMPMPAALSLADFDHVASERDFLLRLLRNAVDWQRPGINVLLHGIPGTGKTEFCKTLAVAIGCTLFAVGECDESGAEPDRGERLDALKLAAPLAARRGNALLLFDEMQDVLGAESSDGEARKTGSKVYFNRLLERSPVPVLWTSNSLKECDPAFLRRMTFILEMKPMPVAVRAGMIEAGAREHGLFMTAPDAEGLARRYPMAPALMKTAIHAVATAGCRAEEIDLVAESLSRAVARRGPVTKSNAPPFLPELANADFDLEVVRRAVASGRAQAVSLFLYGPPGTGKSAFARHLAETMEMEPMLRRGSDLLSKWIGETEQRLARAFAEARSDRRFLIIDEAEPFLWNRSGDSRSWEVSMVDELLIQMEEHTLPFACTTNLPEAVDTAALRRFTLKVKFDFLSADQAGKAYAHFFAREAPPALRHMMALTPSDFASVAKRCRLLDLPTDRDPPLLEMLEGEVAAKRLPARKIGF